MKKLSTEFKTGRQFIARFLPGNDLIEELKNFLLKNKIKAAYIPLLLGAVSDVSLNHPKEKFKKNEVPYILKKYSGRFEFIGQATVATFKKDLSIHLHCTIGGNNHKTLACGHFVSGIIPILMEVVIIELKNEKMTREIDEQVFPLPMLFFK